LRETAKITNKGAKLRAITALPLLALICQLAGAQQAKTVTPTELMNLKQVSDPQISPDGDLVAYVVTTPVAAGEHKNAHIWVASTDGSGHPEVFAMGDGQDISPRWSPDGNTLAFLSDRKNPIQQAGGGAFPFTLANIEGRTDLEPVPAKGKEEDKSELQLWTISLHGGEAVPLTNIAGGIKSFDWSRDGKFIAFVRTDQNSKEERERIEKKNDEVFADHDFKYDRLWIYDVAKHEARLLTKADINIDAFDWSPDGSAIVARVSPTPRIDDYWRISKIVTLSTATGEVEKTIEQHAGYMAPRWSPDGKRIAFSRETAQQMTDEHIIYSLDTDREIRVEDSFPGTVEQMIWMPDGGELLAQAVRMAHTVILRVQADSGKSQPVEGVSTSDGRITVSHDGHIFAFIGNTFTQPDEVWVAEHGHASAVSDTNPQTREWALGSEKEIEWESSVDKRTIFGVLLLPPGYDSGKRYKTVVHIHGGPEEAWTLGWHGTWYNYGALLASHGYVVLLPDPRGSDGAGPPYTEANYQAWGGADFQDIMDGVDSLVAKGIADPDRLVVGGWSFGGYMTAWTVTHTDRFKAGMVGAGVTDLYSMATTTDIAPSFLTEYYGSLDQNKGLYDRNSPVRYLDQCHTPVLVLHGGADTRVPTSQGQEFYNGLRFLGKKTLMVTYPREPHIFTEREHQIDSLSRILVWYDSYTK